MKEISAKSSTCLYWLRGNQGQKIIYIYTKLNHYLSKTRKKLYQRQLIRISVIEKQYL